ncbi:XdhC family protein [Rhizobium sp. 16-449-1b]|uniref:XdhC family protein n=1 Tax=Rhizobium sp. 16-449-1b TaxID=2819989 RepID=UPI001ADC554D|nr:XdhC family protein [Rhizobium sp. 16-449-1b]MBO9198299.1 XdhC family protein [Rhizobium sp. 16-449-1b]
MDQIANVIQVPVRTTLTDDPVEILTFAADAVDKGGAALATLVEIRGGAARALGSHVAISRDGRYCGYVSGGCIEAAVASEAVAAIAEGRDRLVSYGDGSPFFDIVLPCGGGITVAIHVLLDNRAIRTTIESLRQRRPAALRYSPTLSRLTVENAFTRSAWHGDEFVSVYQPCTRLLISGRNLEAQAVAAVARASGYDVVLDSHDTNISIDDATAVVILHHDLDAEENVLERALSSAAFYVGALGSTRTHRRREERLRQHGWARSDVDRIKAPIGFFGLTRDASSLALSVLADVAAARLAARP